MNKIAIIGAGPSGLLLALYLVQHSSRFQHQVAITFFERENSHDLQDRSNPDRSYTIDITGHGLRAIRSIGRELEGRFDRELIPFRGIHAYPFNKTMPYSEKGWTGSRGDICSSLQQELEAKLSSSSKHISVELNWNSEVIKIDSQSGEVTYTHSDHNNALTGQFDLIIGADGSGSMLRRFLAEEKLLETQKSSISNYSRILHLDAHSANLNLEPSVLHAFSLNPWAVGGAVLDTAPQQKEVIEANTPKKFYVQLGYSDDLPYDNKESAEKALSQIRLSAHELAHKTTESSVPLRHYVSDSELESFASRPVYHTGKTVKCSTLAISKCVLIGDAATAFPPVGQGVNAAFEGATVLGKILADELSREQTTPDLKSSMQRYSDEWLPQANACADIANTVVYGSTFCRAKLLLQGLFAEITGIDIAAAQLAKHSEYSYLEAKRKSQFRNGILLLLVTGVGVSVGFALI